MSSATSALALNLSFVLHEPSTSAQVARAARAAASCEVRARRAEARLGALPDRDLLDRAVVTGPALQSLGLDVARVAVLSPRLGPWRLLPRLLACALASERHLPRPPETTLHLIDAPGDGPAATVSFFRGEATLALPPPETLAAPLALFAWVVLRPGDQSLHLHREPLALAVGASPLDALQACLPLAEEAIRSHVGQWCCSAPLWARPAERELPELRGR
ncbi:MAG: hypothetical protein IRY97_00260 [Thermomicrobiaceae bacterium]|nr:hypothetical protein [Thermomicrobiaceae bacterium]